MSLMRLFYLSEGSEEDNLNVCSISVDIAGIESKLSAF